jgi:hypothetical protein
MKTSLFFVLIAIFFLSSCKGRRVGAVCNDGWKSHATGRGACSHHGGVDYWVHERDDKQNYILLCEKSKCYSRQAHQNSCFAQFYTRPVI